MEQPTYRSQDELVELFARSLNLAAHHPSTPDQQFTFTSTQTKAPIYASQHYTHSAYVPSRFNNSHDTSDAAIDYTLRQHDVNPAYLFTCQVDLFRSADPDLRLRLLELWRTAPIRPGDKEAITERYGELHQTNLLQEEVMARLRHERSVSEQGKSLAEAEPYMISGYTASSNGDGVSNATQGPLWGSGREESAVEDQYGAFLAARNFERFQELHRQVAGSRQVLDDEMVA